MIFFREFFVDANASAVRLNVEKGLLASHFNILGKMKDYDPTMFGGALRDAIAGVELRDYDICLGNDCEDREFNVISPELFIQRQKMFGMFAAITGESTPIYTIEQLVDMHTANGVLQEDVYKEFIPNNYKLNWRTRDKILNALAECGIEVSVDPHELTYTHISMLAVKGKLEGQDCDFVFADSDLRKPAELAMLGDAPINCVAMDGEGNVWAHPDFEEDLAKQRYRVRVYGDESEQRAQKRFQSLRQRYPGLTLSTYT